MTFTEEMNVPTSTCDRTRQLHIGQLLHGPAQRVLAYTFSFAYTQKCDVLTYITKNDLRLHFNDQQIRLLARDRNPSHYTIPILYKIFRFCCDGKLQDQYSRDWDCSSVSDGKSTSLEAHIATIHQKFNQFSNKGTGDVESLRKVILGTVQRVGESLGVNKWKQQYESIKTIIGDILEEVYPGVDVKERVLCAAKVESQLRNESIRDALESMMAQTKKTSSLDPDEIAGLLQMPVYITAVNEPTADSGSQDFAVAMDEAGIPLENILDTLQLKCNENIDGKKIGCISGDLGVGKSALAAVFPYQHLQEETEMKHLNEYEFVFVVSGEEIERTSISKWIGTTKSQRNDLSSFIDDYWSIAEAFLPRCCAKYGVSSVGHMLTTRKILFVVDDADELSDGKIKELVLFLGQILFESSALILGSTSSIQKIKFSFVSFSSVQHFHLHGISRSFVSENSTLYKETIKTGKKRLTKSFRDSFKNNLNRIGYLIEYPQQYQDILALWKTRSALVRESYTATELLWNLFMWKAGVALETDLRKDIRRRKKLFSWFILVGEMTLYCIKANIKLNPASLQEIKDGAIKLFSREEGEKLTSAFFGSRLVFNCDSFRSIPSSTTRAQLEFFSSYYIIHKLATSDDECIEDYLPKTNPEAVLAFIAGHLKRWDGGEVGDEISVELSFELMQDIIESVVNYENGKNEDVEFLMKIATEFKNSHKLVQLMVNITEYPEEWDLNFNDIQQKTLEIMMQHVAPVRIILRIDRPGITYEQMPVLKFLGRVPISIWFESKEQFQYGSDKRMDKMLRPMLSNNCVSRIDLLSGSLSRITTMDMLDFKCMSYLVMIALKVTDEESLSTALSIPQHLPNLLWFELKIDMSIENVVLTSLPSMEIEMFDVYLRDLDDLCVPQITGILTKMHKRYSGIHLDHTSLSPESVYTLLKELKRRGIVLCASPQSIDKYRRWYYPLLAGLPTNKLLSDEEVRSILGFEDRKYYSDHKIQSSTFVKSIDAWNLTSYLEELKEIKYFMYQAANLSFVKTLEGEVETEHHSSSTVKVDTTGTIL